MTYARQEYDVSLDIYHWHIKRDDLYSQIARGDLPGLMMVIS